MRKKTIPYKGSFDIQDVYSKYKKELNIKCNQYQFKTIVREMNNLLAKELEDTGYLKFPEGMGEFYMCKKKNFTFEKNGKFYSSYLINWNETLKLLKNDEEAKKAKAKVYYLTPERVKFIYSKRRCTFKNSKFVRFHLRQVLAKRMVKKVFNDEVITYQYANRGKFR